MFGNFEVMISSSSMFFVYGGNRRPNHYTLKLILINIDLLLIKPRTKHVF